MACIYNNTAQSLWTLLINNICDHFLFLDGYVYDYEDPLPTKQYFITNNNRTVVLKNEYCLHMNVTRWLSQYHAEVWFHNGAMLQLSTNDKYNSSFLVKQNGEVTLMLKVNNLSAVDLGEYIGVISVNVYDVLSSCNNYHDFLPFVWQLFYRNFPIATAYHSIDIYSKYTCMTITLHLLHSPD